MGKLNLANYRPKDDSSTNTDQYRAKKQGMSNALILVVEDGECGCGCQQKTSRTATFRMGHDARLRGKLIRAHCTDTPVAIVDGDQIGVSTAMEVAAAHGWEGYLKVAKEREELRAAERAERANRQVLARATGPRVGDRQCVKVGRWMKTGNVIAVFSDGQEIEVEYVDSKGNVQRKMISREQAAEFGTGDPVEA